jgi:Mrp family chromosome partitioning ATPase
MPALPGSVDVFSTGGGERTAREMKVNFLGRSALDPGHARAGGGYRQSQ